MADRTSSAFCYLALIFHLILLIECNYGVRYGDKANRLHIAEDNNLQYRKPLIIEKRDVNSQDNGETSFERTRRDVPPEHPHNNPNITTKVSTTYALLSIAIFWRSFHITSLFNTGIGNMRVSLPIFPTFFYVQYKGKHKGKRRYLSLYCSPPTVIHRERERYIHIDVLCTIFIWPCVTVSPSEIFSEWCAQHSLCVADAYVPRHNCRIICPFRNKFNQSRRNGAVSRTVIDI